MAFTKINAAGIGTTERVTVDGLTIINNLSVGGTVSIAGTLTYEDVTNVDAVGLITARSGINVSGGTATFASDVSIADKIIHTGDTDTAIRFPAADNITGEVGGIERLRINSTGIGVTGRLSVHHSIVDTEGEFLRIGRTDLPTIRYHSIKAKHGGATVNNYISFLLHDISDTTSQSEVLRLRGDGFVGIGSTVPAYTLDLGESSSTIRLVSENDGTAIRVGTGGNSSDVTLIRVDGASANHDGESDDSANGFSFKYLGSGSGVNNRFSICPDNQAGTQSERVTVLQDGKTGIGTSAPATNLHVTTTAASAIPLTIERTSNNNAVVHYKNSTLSMYSGLAGEGLGWGVGTGADLGDASYSKLMVTSAGDVGIGGVIAPETDLHVKGNLLVQNTIGNNLTVRSTVNNGNDPNIRFQKARGGAGTTAIVQDNDDLGMLSWSGYDGNSYEIGAYIYAEVEGTPADGDMPTRMVLATRASGAGTGTGRIVIDSGGDVKINTGDLLFSTAGKGIVLGATSNTDANTLDDYEEGTFTPTTNEGTFTNAEGKYTKIGNQVTVWVYVPTISDTTSSSNFIIASLPFSGSATMTQSVGSVMVRYLNSTAITGVNLSTYQDSGWSSLRIYSSRDDGNNYEAVKHSDFTNTGVGLRVCHTYQAA